MEIMTNIQLSEKELKVLDKWRRQYRHRWLACILLGACFVVGMCSGVFVLIRLAKELHGQGVPMIDILLLKWFLYLGEPETSSQLLVLCTATIMILSSAFAAVILFATFRISFPRYRLMEKLLRSCEESYKGGQKRREEEKDRP